MKTTSQVHEEDSRNASEPQSAKGPTPGPAPERPTVPAIELTQDEFSHVLAALAAMNEGARQKQDLSTWAKKAILAQATRHTWKGNPMLDLEVATNHAVGLISMACGAVGNSLVGMPVNVEGSVGAGIDDIAREACKELHSAFSRAWDYAYGKQTGSVE
jgi:hypothetical protein